jgi:hypothetical protein
MHTRHPDLAGRIAVVTGGPRRRQAQGGPPLGILAVVFTALFVAGLAISTAMAGGHTYPSPFSDATGVVAYFHDHRSAVAVSGFFQFGAAIPLAVHAATVSVRLRTLGIQAPGATIAQVGGVLAAAFLALSGLVSWVLSRPEIDADPSVVRALHDLGFAAGGVGHVVPLGLLVAGIAVPGWLARLLPRWLAFAGLGIAAVAELATLSLLVENLSYLLPLARFTALAWLVVVGFLLPRTRPVR